MNKKPNFMLPALLAVGLLAELFYLTGCRTSTRFVEVSPGVTNTVTVNELDPVAGETISGVLAIGVPYAVQADANAGPYLQLAATAFRAAADSGQYDPKSLQSALDSISVRELRDPTAQRLITTAMKFYRASYAEAVNAKMDQTKWGPFAEGLLIAMADGIDEGLLGPAPALGNSQ